MNLEHIREFLAIVEHKSFSIAAQELCMSQSSLSKHIIHLEQELDIQLFDRSARQVTISDAGRLFLPYAQKLYDTNEDFTQALSAYKEKNKSTLKIASLPVMAQYEITGAIASFRKSHPEISLVISTHEANDILRLMEQGEFELAFIRRPNTDANLLNYITFYEDHLVALLPDTNPLSQKNKINLNSLKDEEFMFLDNGTLLYRLCYDTCVKAGFTPKIGYTGQRPENLIDLVSKDMGITLLMRRHAEFSKHDNVSIVEIEPQVTSSICLAHIKNRKLSKAAKQFWDYIAHDKPLLT